MQPALIYLLGAYVFELAPVSLAVAVTMAALPTGINAYLFAARYDAAVPEATSTILISTLVSVMTLGFLLTSAARLSRSRNPVERVRQQECPLGMAAGQVGGLIADIGDDRIALGLDRRPSRRLEVRGAGEVLTVRRPWPRRRTRR